MEADIISPLLSLPFSLGTGSGSSPPSDTGGGGAALPTSSNPNSVSGFLTSMLINGTLGLVLILLFLVFRRRIGWIYAPRLNPSTRKSDCPPPPLGQGLLDCFSVVLQTPESAVLRSAGPDALILARFFRLCCVLFFVSSLLGVVMLIVNVRGSNGRLAFEQMSIANVADESPTLLLHCAIAWAVSVLSLYLMFRVWIGWVTIRHAYLSSLHRQDQNLTILVRNIPRRARSDDGLSRYFSTLYPLNFHSAVLCKDTTRLELIIERRQYYLQQLEHAFGLWGETGQKPKAREKKSEAEQWVDGFLCSHRCHGLTSLLFRPLRGEVDAVDYYSYKLNKYNALVDREQKRIAALQPAASGFVSFKTALVTNTAVRVEHNPRPFLYSVQPAPLVHDVYWPSLLLSRKSALLRNVLVNSLIAASMLFWSVPMAFIQSLSDLNALARLLPPLRPIVSNLKSMELQPLVEGYLPSLALMLIMLILPVVLLRLCQLQGIEARSWQQQSLLHKYFLFQIFIFLIVNALSQVLLSITDRWGDLSVRQLLELCAVRFPAVAPFFINFIMLRALTGFPLQLVRLWPLLWGEFSLRYRCKTEREKRSVQEPPCIDYGEEYPEHMLIFTVGVTYAIIAPVVLPFVYLYFLLGYCAKLYQSLYVTVSAYESGGMYWPPVFQRLTLSLLLSQLTAIGIFLLKGSPLCSSLMLPLPVITCICNRYVWSAYWEKGRVLPVEIAEEVDRQRKQDMDRADEGGADTPKRTYDAPDIDKEFGDKAARGEEGDGLQAEERKDSSDRMQPSSTAAQRQRGLPEDTDAIQRSDHDIRHKAKRQDRNSRAWGDLQDMSARVAQQQPAAPTAATPTVDNGAPPPIVSPSALASGSVSGTPPDDRRVSLHPSKHIHTASISQHQLSDRALKRTLHPYTQPELLAPSLLLPDLDAELRSHAAFASTVDSILEQQYATPSSSPFGYDEDEELHMQRETERQEQQMQRSERERERKRRARRATRRADAEGERDSSGGINVPAGVATALLSSPQHRQVYYSGEAERRGWPSISLNVAEEWGDDDEDDDV